MPGVAPCPTLLTTTHPPTEVSPEHDAEELNHDSRDPRDQRLLEDFAGLERVRQTSTIFSFEPGGTPPDRYELSFRGRGVARRGGSRGAVEFVDEHRVELRLPGGYPEHAPGPPLADPDPPSERVLQRLHSAPGYRLALGRVGDTGCGVRAIVGRRATGLCRSGTNDAGSGLHVVGGTADAWTCRSMYDRFRDRALPAARNVIRYQRRGAQRRVLAFDDAEVLFIGEDTPVPPLPWAANRGRDDRDAGGNEILYIGDD